MLATSAASTTLSWNLGIWDQGILKDAITLTFAVVLPMTFRSLSFKSGGELAQNLVRETLCPTTLWAFYLDATPLPLVEELVFQVGAALLILFQGVARTKTEWHPVKRLCDWIIGLMGLFLIVWSTSTIISSPSDWSRILGSFAFHLWLSLSLLPFFYIFGFYGATDTLQAQFRAHRRPFTQRLMTAFMIGTRLRLSLPTRFSGRYDNVAEANGS